MLDAVKSKTCSEPLKSSLFTKFMEYFRLTKAPRVVYRRALFSFDTTLFCRAFFKRLNDDWLFLIFLELLVDLLKDLVNTSEEGEKASIRGGEEVREKSIFWCGLQSKFHLLRLKTTDGSVIPKPLLTAKSTVASHYRNWRELVDATAQTNLPQLPPDRATLGRTVRLNPLVPCSRCLPATTPSETKIQP
ncbi:hypothetical protein J6590_075325 [Homalodisca vitripennis]|nr:hypothetical protein J6590_075325 [Homalodisca vitripennis]